MTLEQVEDFATKLDKIKELMTLRSKLEKAIEDGKRESIKIQSMHIHCDSATGISMLRAGIEALSKEIEELDSYLSNLEVVPKSKKKGGE